MVKGLSYSACLFRYNSETCRQYIDLQTNTVVAALKNGILFTPYFCSLFVTDCSINSFTKISANDFFKQKMAKQTSSNFINDLYKNEITG